MIVDTNQFDPKKVKPEVWEERRRRQSANFLDQAADALFHDQQTNPKLWHGDLQLAFDTIRRHRDLRLKGQKP